MFDSPMYRALSKGLKAGRDSAKARAFDTPDGYTVTAKAENLPTDKERLSEKDYIAILRGQDATKVQAPKEHSVAGEILKQKGRNTYEASKQTINEAFDGYESLVAPEKVNKKTTTPRKEVIDAMPALNGAAS